MDLCERLVSLLLFVALAKLWVQGLVLIALEEEFLQVVLVCDRILVLAKVSKSPVLLLALQISLFTLRYTQVLLLLLILLRLELCGGLVLVIYRNIICLVVDVAGGDDTAVALRGSWPGDVDFVVMRIFPLASDNRILVILDCAWLVDTLILGTLDQLGILFDNHGLVVIHPHISQ